ncbi:MAG: SUMF1/EgtB/PvdO family nonheme iron enzyme [Candidatus Poribacteria bacterium]|nr:SUMF1/EgtB/PvdO family nonheme iron enzyme [Candidatus Poribacteria bacterium]
MKNMVLIPAGNLEIGSVNAFYIDTHPVRNLEYQQFLVENPQWQKSHIKDRFHDGDYLKHWDGNTYPEGKANHPVVYVSWFAAMAYALWAGKRLPTEAEWEYAARGGLANQNHPWGDTSDTTKANYDRKVGDTTPVGKYSPNGYGLYDITGNIWEWCLDLYDDDFFFATPRKNPRAGTNEIGWLTANFTDIETIPIRALRGGGWSATEKGICVTHRLLLSPTNTIYDYGFRCAQSTLGTTAESEQDAP